MSLNLYPVVYCHGHLNLNRGETDTAERLQRARVDLSETLRSYPKCRNQERLDPKGTFTALG